MKNKVLAVLAVFFLVLLGAVALRADDNDAQPGVARVSVTHGDVSTQRGDSGDWVATSINAPIVAGDWLLTGSRSRTEVQLDYANVLRMSEEAEVKIAELSRTRIQVQVRRGLVNFDVFKDSEADVEIDTPNVAVRPVREGSYRILVLSEDETQVIVRKGEADITTPQGSTAVKKGELITIRGRDNPEYQVSDAPRKDAWDDWNNQRDDQILDARSYERTNRYYTGVSDLDRHGRWIYVGDYGWVWTPYGGPDWVPYRYGRWVWEPYWGWTWVSYEPWGWAPYHYGRWFRHASYWCWWPGPVHAFYRPIWAPAYVAFFGWGHHSGFGFGFGFGNIGWLPIGPGDYYYPWWGGHRRTVNVINITNINITNINRHGGVPPLHRGGLANGANIPRVLQDANLRRGVTAMPSGDFGRRAVPRTGRPAVTAGDLRQGQVVAGNVPVVPTRESLKPVDRAVGRTVNRPDNSDRFFTRRQPTSRPESFHTEAAGVRDAIERRQPDNPARPGLRTDSNRPTETGNPRSDNSRVPGRDERTPNAANDRLGDRTDTGRPAALDQAEQPRGREATPTSKQAPGWRRFGGDRPQVGTREPKGAGQQTGSGRTVDRSTTPAERERPQARPDRQAQPETRTPSRATPSERPGFRKFEPQERSRDRAPARQDETRPSRAPDRESSPDSTRRPSGQTSEERPGFRPFTPQSDREDRGQRSASRGDSMGGDRSYPSSRGSDSGRSVGRQSSADRERPPLDFNRPIVEPRSSPRGGGEASRPSGPPSRSMGGGESRPSGSPPRSMGGGESRPSGSPPRSMGGGGGSRSSGPQGGGRGDGGRSTPPSGGGRQRH